MLFLLEEKAIRRSNLKLTEMELKHLDVIVRAIPSEVLQTYVWCKQGLIFVGL